jgi:D-arabinose 1-dehydrogenase-like Zn-dependent alcohol dehydrogenase
MLLITAGFETYVYSRSKAPNFKADLVKEIGATYISNQTTSIEQLGKLIGNIDLVYEAAGSGRTAFDVMRILGTNAIFIAAGVPEESVRIEVDTDLLLLDQVLKNQVIFGTVNADRAAFISAIRDLAIFKQRWPHALTSLITGRYTIEQAPQLLLGNMGGVKNIVVM